MYYSEIENKQVNKGVKLSSAKVYVSKFKRVINHLFQNPENLGLEWIVLNLKYETNSNWKTI